jgi:hypothetical protein
LIRHPIRFLFVHIAWQAHSQLCLKSLRCAGVDLHVAEVVAQARLLEGT